MFTRRWLGEQSLVSTAREPLGDFTLVEFRMKQPPDGLMGWLGARRFHWAECYYFGNPGLYRTYALAVNDAGWMEPLRVDLLPAIPVPRLALGVFAPDSQSSEQEVRDYLNRSDVATFRSTARPNTYAVFGAHLHFGDISTERMGCGPRRGPNNSSLDGDGAHQGPEI
ncbi:MAG: ETEC_3214 domain-containing protein [Actinomycetota bacterium]